MTRPSTPWGPYPWEQQPAAPQAAAPAAAAPQPAAPVAGNMPNPLYPAQSPYPYVDASGRPTQQQQGAATASEQATQQATTAGQQPPSIGAPRAPGGLFSVDQTTAAAANEVQGANQNVAAIWDQLNTQQATVDKLRQDPNVIANPALLSDATTTLNSLYTSLSAAQQRVESANASYSTALTKAIDQNLVDPSQVQLVQAQATKADNDSALAAANAKVLLDGADTQKAKVSAEAGLAANQANYQQALADATTAKTPAEMQALQAQAAQSLAAANQIKTLLPGLVQKQAADTTLTQAQAGLTDAQSGYYQAQTGKVGADQALSQAQADLTRARIPGETGLLGAQTGLAGAQAGLAAAQAGLLTPAQAAAQNATTAAALANIQKGQLGPMYGLQDQINAIRSIQQQVFGPGGSGDQAARAQQANDLLNQFTTATIGGTTPYAAATTAAGALQSQFGTQASLANAAQAAAASRANALQGAAASAFGQLASMNANAPAGSTAMAGAFRDVLSQLGAAGNQYAPPPQMPTPPQLPSFLQQFSGPSGAGGGAGAGAAPSGSGSNAPVTINIGGQGQAAGPPPGFTSFNQNQNQNPTQPGGPGMPAFLQGSVPLSPQQASDYWHQLWAPELQSGAVQSPYASGGGGGLPSLPGGLTYPTPGAATPSGALPAATGPGPGTPSATSMYY